MGTTSRRLFPLVLGALLFAHGALAQRSGGRMGGRMSSSPGFSSNVSSRMGSSNASGVSWPGRGTATPSRCCGGSGLRLRNPVGHGLGDSGVPIEYVALLVAALAGLWFVVFRLAPAVRRRNARPAPVVCEVRRITIGFDWTARDKLQTALDYLAGHGALPSTEGIHRMAEGTAELLVGALPSARYAAWQSFKLGPREADERFEQMCAELRTRFEKLVRSDSAQFDAPEVHARAEEGEGLVVVTVVVGTEKPLPTLPTTLDHRSLEWALRKLVSPGPGVLRALEVVWSPALADDRLSSAELEKLYPELSQLVGGLTPLGRASCAFCHGVYARELLACPACGASEHSHTPPSPDAKPATAYVDCAHCHKPTPGYETQCQNCGARAVA